MTKLKTIKIIQRYRIIWTLPDGTLEAEARTWPNAIMASHMAKVYQKEGIAPSMFHMIEEEKVLE